MQIVLSGNESNSESRITIPLDVRTNVGYELKMEYLSSDGYLPAITTSIVPVRASGAALINGAAESSQRTIEIWSNAARNLHSLTARASRFG